MGDRCRTARQNRGRDGQAVSESKYAGTAWFSDCELYRHELTREGLIPGNNQILFDIGLNPSTATAEKDDRTIARGIAYAIAWGYGRLVKCNAYDFRTKDPKILFKAKRDGIPIVHENCHVAIERNLRRVRDHGGVVVASWGGNIEPFRQQQLEELLGGVAMCVKINDDKWRTPKHYLYARNDVQLVPWRRRCG